MAIETFNLATSEKQDQILLKQDENKNILTDSTSYTPFTISLPGDSMNKTKTVELINITGSGFLSEILIELPGGRYQDSYNYGIFSVTIDGTLIFKGNLYSEVRTVYTPQYGGFSCPFSMRVKTRFADSQSEPIGYVLGDLGTSVAKNHNFQLPGVLTFKKSIVVTMEVKSITEYRGSLYATGGLLK